MAAPPTTAARKYQPTTTKYQPIHIRRCFKRALPFYTPAYTQAHPPTPPVTPIHKNALNIVTPNYKCVLKRHTHP